MTKEELNEALKILHKPIVVNSINYKYFDEENYNKLLEVVDYAKYLYDKVKPYVEAQEKQIDNQAEMLQKIFNIVYSDDNYEKQVKQVRDVLLGKGE